MPAHAEFAGCRALVLDDQEDVADLLSEMVRLIGCETATEYDPQIALRRIEEGSFDVILSDYCMPEMDGQEFYRAAIALRPELAPRIIFITGDSMNDETLRFLCTTGAPWLLKPFRLASVEEAIREALKSAALSYFAGGAEMALGAE